MTKLSDLRTYRVAVNVHRYSDHSDPAQRTSVIWRTYATDPQEIADNVRDTRDELSAARRARGLHYPYIGIVHGVEQ